MGRRALSWLWAYGDWPLLFVLLMVGCYFFLLPASLYMFQGKTDMYLGDGGGDPQTLAFQNNVLIQTALHRPGLMFFGAVYTPQLQAPDGLPMWVPWLERILVPTLYAFTKSAANLIVLEAWVILVLNGLCFHALARTLKWPTWLGIVASLCWAFNPYTRARVDAHMLFAATYYLPILFIGIHRAVHLSQSTHKRRDYLVAAACFVFTMFSAHYYIVATLFLSLPILVYALMTWPAGTSKIQATVTLVLATLPAVAFLGWNMLVPVPKGLLPEGIAAVPVNTQKEILYALAARPIDYLGGDLRFGVADWNPWRAGINKLITTERPHSCEPVNGIRWSILGFAALGLLQTIVPKVKKSLKRDDRARILALFGFTLIAFLLSVPPDFLVVNGEHLGLALRLHGAQELPLPVPRWAHGALWRPAPRRLDTGALDSNAPHDARVAAARLCSIAVLGRAAGRLHPHAAVDFGLAAPAAKDHRAQRRQRLRHRSVCAAHRRLGREHPKPGVLRHHVQPGHVPAQAAAVERQHVQLLVVLQVQLARLRRAPQPARQRVPTARLGTRFPRLLPCTARDEGHSTGRALRPGPVARVELRGVCEALDACC